MDSKIMRGFPVRRCSWSCKPVVRAEQTRRMIRWLDLVCLRQMPKRETDHTKRKRAERTANGI